MLTQKPKISQKFSLAGPGRRVRRRLEIVGRRVRFVSLLPTTGYRLPATSFHAPGTKEHPPACPRFVAFRFPACVGTTCFAALFSRLCGIPAKEPGDRSFDRLRACSFARLRTRPEPCEVHRQVAFIALRIPAGRAAGRWRSSKSTSEDPTRLAINHLLRLGV